MSSLGYQKAQLTKAANKLRKKIAEVEQANLETEALTFEPGKDYELVKNRIRFLSNFISLISRAASSLRSQREKAEEFARQNPDEQGEFTLLHEILAHWDSNEMDDLLDEADTLLDRLGNEIKLLPNADMLYDRYVSSVASMHSVPNSNLSRASSNQPLIPTQQLAQGPEVEPSTHPLPGQDRPSDPSLDAPAEQAPMSETAIPSQGKQCSQPLSGCGIPPGNPTIDPIVSANPHPPGIPITLPYPNPNPTNPSSSLVPHRATLEQSFTIPAYDIPAFYGDIAKFPAFWNMFKKAVHNNTSVPVSFKFMYLQSRMKGEAADIIADFEPNEEDYDEAVRIIESTYSRPELLRDRLWEKLKQQAPARDNATSQRTTLCSIRATWAQMKRLNEESRSIGVLKTIRLKFPRHTCEKVGELKKKGDSMWTVDELLAALDDVIDQQEKIEDTVPEYYPTYNSDSTVRHNSLSPRRYPSKQPYNRSSSHFQSPSCPSCSRSFRSPSRYQSVRSRSPTPYYPRRSSRSPACPQHCQEYRCAFCEREGHRPDNCFEVRSAKQRRAFVNQNGLCWLCLNQGHLSRFCSAPLCVYCGRPHHPALCFERPRASHPYRPSTPDYRHSSPRRVQFDGDHCTCRHAQRNSRTPSPTAGNRRSPSSPKRQQRSPSAKRTSFGRRASAPPISQNSICAPTSQPTHSDVRLELLDEHQAQVGPHSPSSCATSCEEMSAAQMPRLMVVHAVTRNRKTARDELLTVFLDSGSQFSFICTSLARHLGLTFTNTRTITTLTFGGHRLTEESSEVTLTLWDQFDHPVTLQLWTRDVITTVPRTNNDDDAINDYSDERVEVDVLIGIDNYWRIVDLHRNEKLPSGLILSHTRFGPVLSGAAYPEASNINTSAMTILDDDAPGTEQLVRSLLGLDTVGLDDNELSTDANVIRQFYDTVRVIDGSIYVKFPWKSDHPPLADNKALAFRRLESQYDKLRASPSAWNEYCQTILAQLRAGIIEDVTDAPPSSPNTYYIPHQAVYKEESLTTQLRIVFDASSHQKGYPSLNDCLHQGPSLLPDLIGTLLRSRFHHYLMIADVEKAFHQIHLHEDQRDATRFLWLKDVNMPPSSDNLRILRFTRVPFGINASPFLLNMSIRYFLERDPANRLKEEILANTYVDNVIVGANSTKECVSKQMECKEIFSRMSMNLREFMSNNHQLMQQIPEEDCMHVHGQYVKLLGIKWDPKHDTLHVPMKIAEQRVSSKRTALQAYASTFDPLGFLAPLLIRAKMFIQDLWELGHSWDDPLNKDTARKWNEIVQEISSFHLNVPRFVGHTSSSTYDLVVCSDASKRAYAIAVYIVTRPYAQKPTSTLLFAKAKLAPPGAITIPRMELLACHMAAKTIQFLRSQLKIQLHSIRFLTDSQIVLYWIQTSKTLKTYVANRVNYIRQVLSELKSSNIDSGFYYIPTDNNPADCATRGLTAVELENHIWWHGPSFITTPFTDWPCRSFDSSTPPSGGEAELVRTNLGVVMTTSTIFTPYKSFVPFRRTNSYTRLIRIIAYVLKYVAKLRYCARTRNAVTEPDEHRLFGMIDTTTTSITPSDMTAAELVLIREHYREESQQLNGLYVKKLRTRHEEDGTIRVNLRMANAEQNEPILILSGHPLCTMLISHYHSKLFHAGTSHLIAAIRERFFIPKLKRLVTSVIAKCVTCRRHQGHFYAYPRAPDFPPERVTRSRPFQHIGLDYFGPVVVRTQEKSLQKVWVCLFTCMSTRALHLEVVRDNSTLQFILAFRRFVARRGTPDSVISDNAPTFKLGKEIITNDLPKLGEDPEVKGFAMDQSITWSFITPYSPWKGGFYERLVGSVKNSLKKAVRNETLDLWLFETLIFEIEAVLNTRPLFPANTTNPEAVVLRPIDLINPQFRLGGLNYNLPKRIESSSSDNYESLCTRYNALKRDIDHFWNIWQKDYLAALADREATRSRNGRGTLVPPRVGDIVIIREQDVPRSTWPLGLILQLHTSADGQVRSAKIRTGKRHILDRAINHLVPLEISARHVEDIQTSKKQRQPTRKRPSRKVKAKH